MQLRVFITNFFNKEGLEIIEEKMVKKAKNIKFY